MRPAEEIVLGALGVGIPVKFGDTLVQLSEDGDLCAPCQKIDLATGKEETIYVGLPMEVGQFIRACRKLPEQDLIVLGTNHAYPVDTQRAHG